MLTTATSASISGLVSLVVTEESISGTLLADKLISKIWTNHLTKEQKRINKTC